MNLFCQLYILFLAFVWPQSEPVQKFTSKKEKKEFSSQYQLNFLYCLNMSEMDNRAHMMGAMQAEVQSDTDLFSSSWCLAQPNHT